MASNVISEINAIFDGLQRNINAKTKQQYVKQVTKIIRDLGVDSNVLEFIIKNPERILDSISRLKSSSNKRNYMNSFILIYKDKNEDAYNKFSKLRDELHKDYMSHISTTKPSNWLTNAEYDEIVAKYDVIAANIKKNKGDISKNDLNTLADWIIVSIYQKHNLRADLPNTLIVSQTQYTRKYKNNRDYNYLVIKPKSYSLILNQYKTTKSIGEIVYEFDDELSAKVRAYIPLLKKFLNNPNTLYLIYDKDFKTSITDNALSQRFTAIFKQYGKQFNINLNRKRLVSNDPKYQKFVELGKELKETAAKSGHSVGVAVSNYFKE